MKKRKNKKQSKRRSDNKSTADDLLMYIIRNLPKPQVSEDNPTIVELRKMAKEKKEERLKEMFEREDWYHRLRF